MRWTDAERDAAADLFRVWDVEWKRQLHAYPALANRTVESVASYIKNFLRPTPTVSRKPVEHSSWPAAGVLINGRFVGKRLFEIDQDAVLDHGSFGNISRAVNYSASGCSARWASEAA